MSKDILLLSYDKVFAEVYPEHYKYYMEVAESFGFHPELADSIEDRDSILKKIESSACVIFCGGGDVNPRYYGKKNIHSSVKIAGKYTDETEIKAIKHILKINKPFLAICRGIQVLNVALGGTLYQDLDAHFPPEGKPKYHNNLDKLPDERYKSTHYVNIEKDSLIYRILGKEKIFVNSTHHQAVKDLAPGLCITGKSPDGVIEVVEIPENDNALAVQFHPERMWTYDEDMRKLFKYFIIRKEDFYH